MFLKASIFFLSLGFLYCQQTVDHCEDWDFDHNVDMVNDKLVGIWYLHASIPRFFEYDMKCTFINVTVLGEDHLHFVKHEFSNLTNDARETFGTFEYTRNGSTVMFYTDLLLPFQTYTIALTDDYWVIIACHECGFFSEEGAGIYAYVFTKLQYPACELNAEIMDILEEYGVERELVISHDQNNCPFC